MIDSETIYRKATGLIKRFGTNDPIDIAQSLNIMVNDEFNLNSLLGAYTFKWNHRIIILHSDLNCYQRAMVGGHELGHAILHTEETKHGTFKEFSMFKEKSVTEYEANAFAAHLLIDNEGIMEMILEGLTIYQIASNLNVYVQLVAIIIKEMIRLGYNLTLPCDIESCFLKNTDIDDYSDYDI